MKYRIIAFSGPQGSGKTEATNYFKKLFAEKGQLAKVIKFAQPMYDIQNYIYQVTNQEPPKTKDRKLLQFLGTDWGRSRSPDLWTNLWLLNVNTSLFFDHAHVILTDDCRFDNEADLINSNHRGGIVIRINSDLEERKKRIEIIGEEHSSECGISDQYVHANAHNNGSLEDFHKNLKYLFETLCA